MPLLTVALALAALFVACGCWFALQLLKQNGRLLARLDALEDVVEQLAVAQADSAAAGGRRLARREGTLSGSRIKRNGLEPGTPAPEFQIPRVGGGTLSLAGFRGTPLVLVFSDPQCAPCDTLAPQLEVAARLHGRVVLMVSRGDEAANRTKAARYGLSFPIGLQNHWEISRIYAMFATPIAYLIDANGTIAAPVAKGPDAILRLLTHAPPWRDHDAVTAAGAAAGSLEH